MRTIAVILSLAVLAFAIPARAEIVTDLTYAFTDNLQVHSTNRGAGFSPDDPQLSFDETYSNQAGTIVVRIHAAKSDGTVPIEISERVRDAVPPHIEDTFPRVIFLLFPNGTVDVKRQLDVTTTEEVQLAHFLIPNLLQHRDGSSKTWRLGGVVDGREEQLDYTLVEDDGRNAVLTFEHRLKAPDGYYSRGKITYDETQHAPIKANAEIYSHDINNTSIENLEFVLTDLRSVSI
jgi:hypothetical protein